MHMNVSYFITFKFGGHWVEVKGQSRRKYEGGIQKTVKLLKDKINYLILKEEIEFVCPWLRGHVFEMHYHLCGTSPKLYKSITCDADVLEMITDSDEVHRSEVVIILQSGEETSVIPENTELELFNPDLGGEENIDTTIDVIDDELCNYDGGDENSLHIGSIFIDSNHLRQVLRTEAILNNFALKIKASDKKRVIGVCAHQGCPWRVRASVCSDGQSFRVTRYETTHSCPGVNRAGNKQASIDWVAHQIQDLVKKNPDVPPKVLNDSLERNYGLSLSYMKLWRSREQARDLIFGSVDENYKWVPTLQSELIHRNPGSLITYSYDSNDHSFKRFFVSFKVCVDGFLTGCRYLIGLDACHLKSKHLGVLLSANSLDGNNGLLTIAFAVVESESKATWEWFLMNLSEIISVNIEDMAFISDMEKGLGEAIRNVYPNSEHRVCIRHLWKNLKKFFHCDDSHRLQSLVWTAANALTTRTFDEKVNKILSASPQIHSYLMALPYKWSKSQFSTKIKNHSNTNNMAESFNAWIAEARSKPVVDLVDMIRGMLMERRAKRKQISSSWKGELVPNIKEYMRKLTTNKTPFIIRQSTSTTAEIEGINEREEVDIGNLECTCMLWQLSGLPCIHAVAFIGTKRYPLWHTYIDDCYHVNRYRQAYDGPIATLPGKEQWTIVDHDLHIRPPVYQRPRGRPRKRRLKSFMEMPNKRAKSAHKCSRCGDWGHHRSTCKNPLQRPTQNTEQA